MSEKRRLRGLAIHRPIVYGSAATLIPVAERIVNPDHNMRWTVAVRSAASPPPDSPILQSRSIPQDVIGGCDDLSYFIRKVSFKLHDSYPNPLRVIDKPPFEVNETGWGEFVIYIKIYFVSESGEKAIQVQHSLKLHDWIPNPNLPTHQKWLEPKTDAQNTPSDSNQSSPEPTESPSLQPVQSAIHSWQYDEIVFTEPFESFYQKLLAHPPTPLPALNRFPKHYIKQIGNKGEFGEFTTGVEERESKKLSWAQLTVLMEIDRLKTKLIRKEKELNEIKKVLQQ
ncbi:hypothetical protein O181_042845 [Austropuccinia psidii MF-1]|uniref:Protein AF-9 homolog n=1 Tax=Austropuccinia psidii MF-1 TaxID=1389203 RepID=A0A9Q3DHC7_9BASI|nr:hypothetical protein [Austropuccinia psidii MF-1]